MLYCLSLARSMKSSSQTELWVIASTDQPRWSTFNCHRWERFVICGEPDLASGRLNLYHGIAPIHKICIHLSDFVSNCSLIIVGKTIFAIIFAAFLFSPEQDCQQAGGGEHWSRAQKKISDTDCGYHGCYHSVTRAKHGANVITVDTLVTGLVTHAPHCGNLKEFPFHLFLSCISNTCLKIQLSVGWEV